MVLAPGAWMQQRDKQVILIQCNTFSEPHRVPDTMVYESQQPTAGRGVGGGGGMGCQSLHFANSSPEVWPLPGPSCGSTCRLDKGEARGSQRVPGF